MTSLWKAMPGFFTPNTPLYSEAGGDIMKGERNIAGAKKLLEEAGYDGRPITLRRRAGPADHQILWRCQADLLKRHGMTSISWRPTGVPSAPAAPEDAAEPGRLAHFPHWHAGADCVNPAPYTAMRANGDNAWFGWPNNQAVEAARDQWFAASDLAGEKAASTR
jgi:peptide/nickel transport system substrate-binding protein